MPVRECELAWAQSGEVSYAPFGAGKSKATGKLSAESIPKCFLLSFIQNPRVIVEVLKVDVLF